MNDINLALELAGKFEHEQYMPWRDDLINAANELRRLNERVEPLEAELRCSKADCL